MPDAAACTPAPPPPPALAGAGRPSTARALALATVTVILWGVSFPVSRVAVREISPLALATARFAIAAALLVPAARRRGFSLARADLPAVLLLGLLGVTLYFALENYGLVFTTASHASLIVATVPLGSAAVEAFRRRRAPRPLSVAGMAVAILGVALIVRPEGADGRGLLGDLLVLGAMAAWVAYTFLARDLMARYPALLVTASTMAAGAATLLPLAAGEAFFRPLHAPSPAAWFALAYLGLLCSALAYLFWNVALPVLGVPVANNLLNVIPLVSVLTGVLALGEPFTLPIAVGGALVLLGVVVVERTGVERGSSGA
ncbi:MAG TPA: DMT family transporter [Anaeromyxobacter sp.]|nr:DMT family transporter [Anaeromyxobacter sp.]